MVRGDGRMMRTVIVTMISVMVGGRSRGGERAEMAEGVRERMVCSAVVLLSRAGVQGASFGEVDGRTGAPRGSIYHHFPGGKDGRSTTWAPTGWLSSTGFRGLAVTA